MARPWRLARSLERLRDQINERFPDRNKRSDGTIGDILHASRESDHNAWINDGKMGVVSALDITHCLRSGMNTWVFADHLRLQADARIKYCLTPETPILHADLTWHPIGDAKVGDRLVAFDERGEWKYWHARARKNAVLGFQKMRTAVVEATETLVLPSREVITDKCTVKCSSDHAWLLATGQEGQYRAWRATDNLDIGAQLQYLATPWHTEDSFEAGWVAGIFDGEGCLSRPENGSWILSVAQKEGDVLERLAYLLDEFDVNYAIYEHATPGCQSIHIRGGIPGVIAFLGRFRCVRLTEKAIADQIWLGTSIGRAQNSGNIAIVQKINDIGRQEVIALQTSTRTLFANGIYSHNCISNRRIFSSTTQPWIWRRYTGSNPHSSHIHISVRSTRAYYDDTTDWNIDFPTAPGNDEPEPDPDNPAIRPVLRRGSTGEHVRTVQRLLVLAQIDGIFGPITEAAVRAFQQREKLVVDGIIGPLTWARLDLIEALPLPFNYAPPRELSEPE